MKEIWKPVKGYEGLYEVSNLGRVKSLFRKDKRNRNTIPEKILTDQIDKPGYCRVIFHDHKRYSVHRLVCTAFIKNTEGKPQVNHKNGIKTDNRLSNLEWVTRSENSKHAYKTGLQEPTRICKLNDSDVLLIRKYSKAGLQGKIIHSKYFPCVSYQAVSDIIARRRWSHI